MDVTCLTDEAETFTANVYLVVGRSATLIDAGAMSGIEAAVSAQVPDLESIVLTHQHDDHVAELNSLLEAFEPAVYAAEPAEVRQQASADEEVAPRTGNQPTLQLEDGDTITIGGESFEVVETPGHAPDHLVFVGETAVFSGDIVVYSDGAFDDGSFGRTDLPGADRETLIESLDRLLERVPSSVESLYPGHGPPFHGDVRGVIERARDRAARREPKYE